MIASSIYYLFLRNADLSFGRKISVGLLVTFVLYYSMYYGLFEGTVFANWFLWILAADIFVLGVLLVKYKQLNWGSFMFKAVNVTA